MDSVSGALTFVGNTASTIGATAAALPGASYVGAAGKFAANAVSERVGDIAASYTPGSLTYKVLNALANL